MKKEAYLIGENGQVVASLIVPCNYPKGHKVRYSYQRCKEALNANRDWNLVNAKTGKISYAKRIVDWAKSGADFATEINPGEFYID